MNPSTLCALLLVLILTGCSQAGEPADAPAWPELQYEPPALVELEQEPLLARHDPATGGGSSH